MCWIASCRSSRLYGITTASAQSSLAASSSLSKRQAVAASPKPIAPAPPSGHHRGGSLQLRPQKFGGSFAELVVEGAVFPHFVGDLAGFVFVFFELLERDGGDAF